MRARHIGIFTLLVAAAVPASAQQRPERPVAGAAARSPAGAAPQTRIQAGPTPEAILRLREQLSLTDAQVNRLETLRQEAVAARRDRLAETMEQRSQLRAGRITAEQFRERAQAQAERRRTAAQQSPADRVRSVLTDQQRVRLAELQVEQLRRQVQAQRMRGAMGGRGAIGGRGMRPNLRGMAGMRGVAPRPGVERLREQVRERMQGRGGPRMMVPRRPGGAGGAIDGLR